MGLSFRVAFGLMAICVGSSEVYAQSTDDKVRDTNEIINTFRAPPSSPAPEPGAAPGAPLGGQPGMVTRGLRSAKKERPAERPAERPPECEAALASDDGAQGTVTRSAKKERDTIAQCTTTAVKLDFLIPFALNSAELDPSAQKQLEQIGKALESNELKTLAFMVAGHTDRRGDADYNLKLSQARAEAVRHYLLENFAVGGKRLKAVGFGYEQPKMQEDPYADINRRVELVKTN